MLGKNHVVFGCTGWLVASRLMPEYIPDAQTTVGALSFAFVAAGALLPDIDSPNSIMGRRLSCISKPLASLQGDMSNGQAFRHSRGITHAVWIWLIGYFLLMKANFSDISVTVMGLAVLFGAFSHLLGDTFTVSGVRLFWPVKFRVRTPFYFKTGTMPEYLMTYALLVVGVLYYLGYL